MIHDIEAVFNYNLYSQFQNDERLNILKISYTKIV